MDKPENRVYIGDVEAYEEKEKRGIERMPSVGRAILTVPAIASGIPCSILGKDENGFYINEVNA